MENKQIAFGVVGVLIGFVLGFFVSQAVQEPSSVRPQAAIQTGAASQLPEGHPPVEQMEQLRQLEAHAQEHPEHADVLIQLGNAYYDMKRFDAAIGWYEKALAVDPGNIDVNNDLGTSYFATGAVEKSLSVLERSLELDADNPVALQNLGWIYFVRENFEQAVKAWSRLVEVHPAYGQIEDVKEHLERAKAQLKQG